jgi:hypothetical protein
MVNVNLVTMKACRERAKVWLEKMEAYSESRRPIKKR